VPPPCNMGLNSLQSHARRSEVQVVFTWGFWHTDKFTPAEHRSTRQEARTSSDARGKFCRFASLVCFDIT
jgi:hypothetical protein